MTANQPESVGKSTVFQPVSPPEQIFGGGCRKE